MSKQNPCVCGKGETQPQQVVEILGNSHFDVMTTRLQQMLHDRRRPSADKLILKEFQRERETHQELLTMVMSLKEVSQHLAAIVQQLHEEQLRQFKLHMALVRAVTPELDTPQLKTVPKK